tara:strand:- start:744 stop:1727 length:984 start_codon:yes stop_codon:yes gene_type:complete
MANRYSSLKGFDSIHDYSVNNNIQDALVEYFDWALLEKGNYFNVEKGEQSPNGNDMSLLRLSSNDSFVSGQVWEGFRQNWIWQSGVSGESMDAPIVGSDPNSPGISGVYINDQFEPTSGVGQYSHSIDYFNGRVIFDSAIPTGSTVQAEYSYKYINVVYANNVPWLREIQSNTTQPTSNFYDVSTGAWDIPPETRLQLPAIAFEIVPVRRFKGYQLGGGQWVYTDVIAHCIAEDEQTRNMLVDIVSLQNDKTINMIDSDQVHEEAKYPINSYGSPAPSALLYPEMIENYYGGCFYIENTMVEKMDMASPNIFGGIVRFTTVGIKTNI